MHEQHLTQSKKEQEKQDEIARIKKEQDDKEKQAKLEEENRIKEEKEKQERLEKEKEYIKYRNSIDFDKFEKEEWKIVFYKKVWEFKI